MALGKWRFSRSRNSRKSRNSSGKTGPSTSGSTTPVESDGSDVTNAQPQARTQSPILRTFPGSLRSSQRSRTASTDDDVNLARLHKPFTKQNLEHQKILSAFEWNFGTRRTGQGAMSICSGISPCSSRRASVDYDQPFSPFDQRDAQPRFGSDLACDGPVRMLGGGFEKDRAA
ncbi:hypothetical protein DL766_004489 [Monosporascus sp. MC13-8B]|uniref:Uncharacterized protein n=1 Tax=Monosporascus cannonballus TaxID=155416 RepID=A0ABY0GZW0_9PEZI|nr:hypothetical protein DL762_007184 [Monosporascus cannonballus]RYO86134.1 hypothetical protein DL763_006827 [Monosporascus cannonballus]RYP31181.1 hypothetical protein DL766_004489 [Monosporascus sp. MC13-8B]